MNNFISSVQSFFHSVTTNDRYATYENNRAQLGYSGHTTSNGFGPVSSFASNERTLYQSASEDNQISNGDLTNTHKYSTGPLSHNNSNVNLASSSSTSLNRLPYTPGMRSAQIGNGGSIPLQEYADGVPPPPPPALSWKRIDRWMEVHYPELLDQLNDGATSLDLNEFESDLSCTLPLDVRDSMTVHDGQERGGRPCGAIFGITLLDLESSAEEWTHWKNTAIKLANMAKAANANRQDVITSPVAGPSDQPRPNPTKGNSVFKPDGNLSWLDHQKCVPEGAMQRVYAHPSWIPMASDYLGNNIGVDLAPGPKGRWGQVILFGREYDCKYVVAPSWAAFLMTFADDLENGNHLISDETEEGELSFRASNGRIVSYFDVLKSRIERLHRPIKQKMPYQSTATSISAPRNLTNGPGRNVSGSSAKGKSVPDDALISPLISRVSLPSENLPKVRNSAEGKPSTSAKSPQLSLLKHSLENNESDSQAKSSTDENESSEISTPETSELVDDLAEEKINSKVSLSESNSRGSSRPATSDDAIGLQKDDLTEVAI